MRSAIIAVMAALLGTSGASAAIYLYPGPNFRGEPVIIRTDSPTTSVQVTRSVRVDRGERWLVCARPRGAEPCLRIDTDMRDLTGNPVMRDIRSVNFRGTSGGSWESGGGGFFPDLRPGTNQPRLRGMASEYFPQPTDRRGERIEACYRGPATPACAADTAREFCRAAGWNGARQQALETVRGRVRLADVLCANAGV
jgi:hypothetical protein